MLRHIRRAWNFSRETVRYKKRVPKGTLFKIVNLFLVRHAPLKKIVNLVGRVQNGADRDVMIQRIDDQCEELAHVCFDKVRL